MTCIYMWLCALQTRSHHFVSDCSTTDSDSTVCFSHRKESMCLSVTCKTAIISEEDCGDNIPMACTSVVSKCVSECVRASVFVGACMSVCMCVRAHVCRWPIAYERSIHKHSLILLLSNYTLNFKGVVVALLECYRIYSICTAPSNCAALRYYPKGLSLIVKKIIIPLRHNSSNYGMGVCCIRVFRVFPFQ